MYESLLQMICERSTGIRITGAEHARIKHGVRIVSADDLRTIREGTDHRCEMRTMYGADDLPVKMAGMIRMRSGPSDVLTI